MSFFRQTMAYDIVAVVQKQLPRLLQDKLQIEIRSDPFHLHAMVRFKDERGRTFDCELELVREGGRLIACKIPDVFLARLCIEV